MKWKTKPKYVPKRGDIRYVRHFALIPQPLSNGNTVWLQFFWSKQRYVSTWDGPYWHCDELYEFPPAAGGA